jgi:hypothetical protein
MNVNSYAKHLRITAKNLGYVSVTLLLTTGLACATLDVQIEKASSLVLGKVATLVVGGGTLFGGGYALIQGNIGKGMAIIGTGVITGIGIALAKNGTIFNLLQ